MWLSGKESVCGSGRPKFDLWVRKIPCRRKWQPTPVFLPGESTDRGAWWATVHVVTKSQTRQQLSIFTFTEDLKQAGHSLQAGLYQRTEYQERGDITLWGHRWGG